MQHHQGGTITLKINLVAFLWQIAIAGILEKHIVLMSGNGIPHKLPIAQGLGIDSKVGMWVLVEQIQKLGVLRIYL